MSQLVHTARQMFESRIAKYDDPHNLEWEWDDVTDKWERHAFSAYMDLVETEKRLSTTVAALRNISGVGHVSVKPATDAALARANEKLDQVMEWAEEALALATKEQK